MDDRRTVVPLQRDAMGSEGLLARDLPNERQTVWGDAVAHGLPGP
jgi:hypothetical protein